MKAGLSSLLPKIIKGEEAVLNGNNIRHWPGISAAAICVLALSSVAAHAQPAWKPDRPVEIILGSAAGNSVDRMARSVQRLLQEKHAVESPIAVLNKPGGGNTVAWNYLNQRPGDGHYLMVANFNLSAGHLTGTSTYSYRDFTPVCIMAHEYVSFVVKADSPIRDGRDLIERLKKDPTSVSFSLSSVLGGANHVASGMALKTAGVDLKKVRTVVFDSAAKAMTAMLGGHVDVVAGSASVPVAQMQAGTVRVIAVTAPRRLGGVYASVPTWREQGADMVFSNYRGFIGPKGLSDAQVAFWERALAIVDQDEGWRADLEKNVLSPAFTTGRETRKYWDSLDGPLKATLGDLGLLR
jgi:putative tricarboxylic transport membrane protein